MADIQEYKCPHCGGTLTFNSATQTMKCPYCDSEIDVAALADFDKGLDDFTTSEELKWEKPGKVWQEGETDGMRVYVCKSCGGQIIGDENLGSTTCPFCGNPIVLMGQFSGELKPDYIIPFKLDKNAAKAAYENHIFGRKLLPAAFKNKNHIDEIKGLYVPYWLFDADTLGRVQYLGTQVRVWEDQKNQYTETRYFNVYREGTMSFSNVPVDGSSKMPDDLMESLEPFDFSEAVKFQTAYMSGYLADKYDVSSEQSMERARERVKESTFEALQNTISGYASLTPKGRNVDMTSGDSKYAMYPIWILNTTYNGEKYTFAMNGQTGKMVGNLPVDNGLVWKYRLKWTAILGAIISAVSIAVWFFV